MHRPGYLRRRGVNPLLSVLAFLCICSPAAFAGDLQVTANNISETRGEIEFQLFAGKDGWLKPDHPTSKRIRISAEQSVSGSLTAVFEDLPPGEYALALYHDQNNNGTLERGFMWRPKEGWGFSNDIKPRFGPPDFKKAKLLISDSDIETSIRLNYP